VGAFLLAITVGKINFSKKKMHGCEVWDRTTLPHGTEWEKPGHKAFASGLLCSNANPFGVSGEERKCPGNRIPTTYPAVGLTLIKDQGEFDLRFSSCRMGCYPQGRWTGLKNGCGSCGQETRLSCSIQRHTPRTGCARASPLTGDKDDWGLRNDLVTQS
jgi:hypothetical protein